MALNKIDISMLEDAGTSGQVLTSDGTNWTSADAAASLPAVGADGNVLTSDGTNWASEESAAPLPAVGPDGNVLTSDGTDWASEESAGGGDSVFPFYKTDGTSDNITITSGQFPFYKADGTLDNIAAPGGGTGLSIAIPGSSVTGDTLYHDGSVYARLPKGTAAQVLKMNSGATAPEWGEDAGLPATGVDGNVLTSDGTNWASEAPAGGGSWTVIGTTNVTSDQADITQTGMDVTTYAMFAIGFSDMLPNSSASPAIKFGTSSGIGTENYDWNVQMDTTLNGSYNGEYDNAADRIYLCHEDQPPYSQEPDYGFSGMYYIGTQSTGSAKKNRLWGDGTIMNHSHNMIMCHAMGLINSPIIIDRVYIFYGGASIARGRITVWGLKHS